MKTKLNIDVKDLMRKAEIVLRILLNRRIESRYRRIFIGAGLDFEEFSQFIEGMDASKIDWKVSKRVNELMIRKYREERELDVYFMLDVSNSMLFGSAKKLKLEYAAEFTAVMAYFVLRMGDKPSLVMFSNKINKFVRPSIGDTHFRIILKELLDIKNYGGGFNINSCVRFIMNTSKRSGIIFIISDFIGLNHENFKRSIKLLSTKFDVVGAMVRDIRDEKLLRTRTGFVLQDPYSHKKLIVVPEEIAIEYEKTVRKEDEFVNTVFKESNSDFFKLYTYQSFIKPIIRFFIERGMRKLLI